MLFTKETDYAIRFFHALQNGEYRSVGTIAEEEMIPLQFAYKILRKLSADGIVTVTRGAKGGCMLAVDPYEVSLLKLIDVIETKEVLMSCLNEGHRSEYRSANADSRIHENLGELEKIIKADMDSCSIGEIINGDLSVRTV